MIPRMHELIWFALFYYVFTACTSIISGNPLGILEDSWCQDHCSSLEDCSNKYQDDYIDLQLKIRQLSSTNDQDDSSIGANLIYGAYFGETVAFQTFQTQFVFDVAQALDVSVCRIYVLDITILNNGDYTTDKSIIVTFRLYPVSINDVQSLTHMVQRPTSLLYQGKVTYLVDPSVGLVIHKWDLSLKLMIHIDLIVNDRNNTDGIKYLDENSKLFCVDDDRNSTYCEFERYFRDDLVMALESLPDRSMIELLRIEPFGIDSVLVKFRLIPHNVDKSAQWVQAIFSDLLRQVHNYNSLLYQGNVTVRVDPTWGVSGKGRHARKLSPYLPYAVSPIPAHNSYERCQATQRCSRGSSTYNQHVGTTEYFAQSFAGGTQYKIPLFADFEDWRQGTSGWNAFEDRHQDHVAPRGSHWSPFDFETKGPTIPSVNDLSNSGLVLNNEFLNNELHLQGKAIDEIRKNIRWTKRNIETAILDSSNRSRHDVKKKMGEYLKGYMKNLVTEENKLLVMSESQCKKVPCNLIFNTSSLELNGTINAIGDLAIYDDGTEVAVWVFDSINLDSNVNITFTGQRSMMLMSRSSSYFNSPIIIAPGTLGGFPGGYSVARKQKDRLVSVCENIDNYPENSVCYQRSCCAGDVPLSELQHNVTSNNINGPGSGSVRVYLKTIEIIAKSRKEIQRVLIDGDAEGTIGGKFRLHYGPYRTSFLNFDITPTELKQSIEQSLNGVDLSRLRSIDRANYTPGVGKVQISRKSIGSSGGFEWRITFESAVGNVEPISASSSLSGRDAHVHVETIQNGTSIEGFYKLHFLNESTRLLRHNISAIDLETALVEDISVIESAEVVRTDPLNKCSDGMCDNGPTQEGGYSWTLCFTTMTGNLSPYSPTSKLFKFEGKYATLNSSSFLDGCVDDICPSIIINDGHERSHISSMRALIAKKPFSFAYGGGGAGFGGEGGSGYGKNKPGGVYGDKNVSKLLGGSGGALGYIQPFEANMFDVLGGRGGAGGGAIGLVAMNDITIGPSCNISVNGEDGIDGMITAGGGGSGGSILLSAGGVIKLDGHIDAKGGNGGIATSPLKKIAIEDGHGGGGGGGRIALFAQTIVLSSNNTLSQSLIGGTCEVIQNHYRNRDCNGKEGSLHVSSRLKTDMYVDKSIGAASTNSSLFIIGKQLNHKDAIGSFQMGPIINLDGIQRPGRVSFYVRLAKLENRSDKKFSVRSRGLSIEFLEKHGRNNSIPSLRKKHTSVVIGIFVGKDIKHGSGYIGSDDPLARHLKSLTTIMEDILNEKWYKIDIMINWKEHTYDMLVNNELAVHKSHFVGYGIKFVRIMNLHPNIAAWIDEIYIGDDFTMDFRCPISTDSGIIMNRPLQTGWANTDIGGESTYHFMQRHASHLSRREYYQEPSSRYIVPFDGLPHRAFHSDIKFRHEHGDRHEGKGAFSLASIIEVLDDQGKKQFIWYGEHNNTLGQTEDNLSNPVLLGGIAACSSYDMSSWKYEGTVLHYVNITDMVKGVESPLHVERPRVLYNHNTSKYVMWMTLNDESNDLNMAGIAVSDYHDGPFSFVRSLYPDGNETRDQTLFIEESSNDSASSPRVFLIRTYYATVDYVLPSAVMQPIWESVKNPDGSTHFGMTYHRSHYDPGYDNFNDILLQRLRKENVAWKVICIDRLTEIEREVPYGEEFLNKDGEVCDRPREYKKIIGQGSPLSGPITSRYLDPNDHKHNSWKPSSVPGVKAQSWSENVRSSECGYHAYETDDEDSIAGIQIKDIKCTDRASSIIDNPIHSTPPDKLIGPERVVESRRAKFIAISQLTDDYLDTTGHTYVVEGEMEDDTDLANVISNHFGKKGQLSIFLNDVLRPADFDTADELSEVHIDELQNISSKRFDGYEMAPDWNTRFHQYERNYNDKADFSVGCIVDGICHVNFKDQIQ